MRQVFLTGGSGFLGAYIIQALVQKGYRVKALTRGKQLPFFIDPAAGAGVEWVEGDLFDPLTLEEAMSGVDAVIHAAAKVSFHSADRDELYKVNVEGTANMVNAAINAGVTRFVYISSVAAVGRSNTGEEVNEDTKWDPERKTTHYAKSKFKAELEVWRGMAEGLNTVILNPSTIVGFGDWYQSSCAIFRNVYNEFPWYTNGINGFVDVEDVAVAALQLMESSISGERFIVSGENWPYRRLFDAIADGFGKKRPAKLATPTLGAIAWRIEKFKSFFTGNRPLLTRESARVAHSTTHFNTGKLRSALPELRFTPLDQSLAKACEKYAKSAQSGKLAK